MTPAERTLSNWLATLDPPDRPEWPIYRDPAGRPAAIRVQRAGVGLLAIMPAAWRELFGAAGDAAAGELVRAGIATADAADHRLIVLLELPAGRLVTRTVAIDPDRLARAELDRRRWQAVR